MESSEFDGTLGGTEHLPHTANSLKFSASRSVEIAAMTESILRPNKNKLIFQTLPVHMRRRVMSHNCKRLPRKLRVGHLEQLKKSGLPPKQKRPSRKYRRRPGNLLEEYNRRQKRNVWLETHIWHAKRFHMIERWGHRLALAPCDKAFRACYRASSAHCLLQDLSYYSPIQISGPIEAIRDKFKILTNRSCGLGICAKAFTTGSREGTINLYKPNAFPLGYIGKVQFIWLPSESSNKTLWLFIHPSQKEEIKLILINSSAECEENIPQKRRKLLNGDRSEKLEIKFLPGIFNRFRLTGPNSHAVLVRSLKCVVDIEKIKSDEWIANLPKDTKLHLKDKYDYWKNISLASSPSQLPPRAVIGLIVRDPRLSRPTHRTKAKTNCVEQLKMEYLIKVPPTLQTSPLWDLNIHETIKSNRFNNGKFIEHVTKTQLVPGEIFLEDPALQSVPVVLIQRPGSQDAAYKKIGYGNGWDVIVPAGYGLPFWQTFTMFGARSGGLRETESTAFEMGECYLPPDSNAGKKEEKRIENELRERYFRLPASKRVNYVKLAINSPFKCPWEILLKDWSDNSNITDFYILRNRIILEQLQIHIVSKKELPQMENCDNCLVAVYIQLEGKGNLKRNALICLPEPNDENTREPHRDDPNTKLRKQKRREHVKDIKRWRRLRMKLKKTRTVINAMKTRNQKDDPSEYVKVMRELWLPTKTESVRYSCSRQILGYVSQAAFSFTESRCCGVGYVAYNAFNTLLKSGQNKILVRNTSSRMYRKANIKIINSAGV